MTDRRSQDPTNFYDLDGPPALPVAEGPDDMPATPAWEGFKAGWRVAKDDWMGESENQVISSYSPIIAALEAETGKDTTYYVWVGRNTGGVNEQAVFADIAKVRARNPGFLPDVPDTVDAWRAVVMERTKKRRADDLGKLDRTQGWGTVAGYAGGFAAAAADPVNLATLPVGGGGSTVARRILSEAVTNMGVEALQQPMIGAERAQRGETLTLGEAATNVGVAGLAGGLLQAGAVEPLSALAKRRLGARATETERAAINIVERDEQIDATSPFKPGPATEVHQQRMAEAEQVLNGERPPRAEPRVSPELSRQAVKDRIRSAESSGDDTAKNPRSTAYGRYQFTASTWVRYYKRRFGDGGLTDAQIAAKRRDPALNEQLMDDLLADNERALASIGARSTPGNLYLAHFAGSGGAKAILKAAPDTPIERLMTRRAIAANPFLKGMTADDVVRWAHRKVGGNPDGPTLKREQFASDEEWTAAQRAVDAAEDDLARAQRDAGDFAEDMTLRGNTEPEPRGNDWMPDGDGVEMVRLYRGEPVAAEGGVSKVGETPKTTKAASDGLRTYTPDEAVARAAAGEGGAVYAVDVPASVVNDLAPGTRLKGAERRMKRELADTMERRVEAKPSPTVKSDVVDDWIISRQMIPETGRPGYRVEQADDGSFATVVLRGHDGRARAGLLVPTQPEALENFGGLISYVSPDIRRKGVATRLYNLARDAGLPVAELSGRGDLTPEGAAFVSAWRERAAPLRVEGAERFDDGVHGEGARSTAQSLEHDLRMAAAKDPDAMVRLEDGGEDRNIRLIDMLDELDDDDAAILAARACMTPKRGGTA